MTKIQAFNVEYENTGEQVYLPGQTVQGNVTVVLKKPTKIRAVRLVASGKAHIAWTQNRYTSHKDVDGSNHFHSVAWRYSDKQNYLGYEVTLWGKSAESKEDGPVMEAGVHRLPFSFELPPKCPSSFESANGSIRYYCKAIIDIPWKMNYTTQRALTVVAPVDLNNYPDLEVAKSEPKTKSIYGFLGLTKSGDIQYELKLPRTGYAPGEIIPFEVTIDNNSNTPVSNASAMLVEKVTVIADNKHTRISKRKVFNVERSNIQPKQVFSWKNDSLRVPPVAPTLLDCRLLKIEYFLKLKLSSKGLHLSDSVKMPLLIGNIPLRSVMSKLNENFMNEVQQNANFISFPVQRDLYPELPLPSYEAVVYGESQINEDTEESTIKYGQMSFAPRYAYYHWTNN